LLFKYIVFFVVEAKFLTANDLITSFMSQTKQIEQKWQATWENARVFEADPDSKKQNVLVTFP